MVVVQEMWYQQKEARLGFVDLKQALDSLKGGSKESYGRKRDTRGAYESHNDSTKEYEALIIADQRNLEHRRVWGRDVIYTLYCSLH